MHTSRPKKPKRQKAAQILNGEAEECESEEEPLVQPKKEPASPPPAPDVRFEATSNEGKDREDLYVASYLRGVELTDDILHIVFSYLQLKDRIRIERGIECIIDLNCY